MRHAACYEPQCIPAGQIYYFRTGHGAQYVHAHLARLRFARLCLENSLGGVDIADILLRSFPTIILCNTPRAHSSYRDWPHVRSGPSSHSTLSLSLSYASNLPYALAKSYRITHRFFARVLDREKERACDKAKFSPSDFIDNATPIFHSFAPTRTKLHVGL